MAAAVAGLEINQREIVLVHVRRRRRGPVLAGSARQALAPGAVTAGGLARPEEVRRAAGAALKEAKAGRAKVALSLALEGMDAREMRYPPMPEQELLNNIRWDLQQLFGGGDEKAEPRLMDVEILTHRQGGEQVGGQGDSRQTYLVVSAPRAAVLEYLPPLRRARLHPDIVDLGAFSLPWALPRAGGVGYLHLGPEITHFVMLENGAFEMQRQGNLPLTPLLAAAREAAPSAENPAVASLLQWLQETLEFVRVRYGSFDVADCMPTLLVSGAGATVPGLLPLMGDTTGVQVLPVAPPLLTEGRGAVAPGEAPAYALALALALRGLQEL